MDSTTVVIGLVGIILGGGGIGALIPIFRFRADRGNVIAVGSEAAVQSLTVALQRSDARILHLEAENSQLRVYIEELKIKVEDAQVSVRTLTRDLEETRKKLDKIIKEI